MSRLLLVTLVLNLQYKVNFSLCSLREESRTESIHPLEKYSPGECEGVASGEWEGMASAM